MRYGVLSALVGLVIFTAFGPPVTAQEQPAQASGAYTITLAGIKVGDFYFHSKHKKRSYTFFGDARFSAFLGTVKWKGVGNASGEIRGSTFVPHQYTYKFRASRKKKGSLKINFKDGNVSKITMQPNKPPSRKAVPVRPDHLNRVFDPLSAMMALSAGSGPQPCGRKISIFDGKLRFDLALRYHRRAALPRSRGQRDTDFATVCRVQFIPVAGHKNNKTTRKMAANRGIEVWFRHVPAGNMYVPHEIRVPTPFGHVLLRARRLNYITRNNRQIALVK